MLLAGMLEAAHTFVQKAAQLAAQEGAPGPVGLPAAVYPPFQSQLDRLAFSTPVLPSPKPTLLLPHLLLYNASSNTSDIPASEGAHSTGLHTMSARWTNKGQNHDTELICACAGAGMGS